MASRSIFIISALFIASACMPLNLSASDAEKELFKTDSCDAAGMAFAEESVTDAGAEAKKHDSRMKPLYMKIITSPKQFSPVAFHVWAWQFKELFIVKGCGVGNPTRFFHAGDETPWISLHDRITVSKAVVPTIKAVHGNVGWAAKPVEESYFTVLFSTTPSDEGVFHKVERSGRGCGVAFLLRHKGDNFSLISDGSESAENLKRAEAVGDVPGKRPVKFPFATTLNIGNASSQEVVDNELSAVSKIGINTFGLGTSSDIMPYAMDKYGFTHRDGYNFALFAYYKKDKTECVGHPLYDTIDKTAAAFKDSLEKSGTLKYTSHVCMMDEPWYALDHISKCDDCIARFPAFLKSQKGLTPQMMGLESFEQAKPSLSAENPVLYYWSARFFNHNMTELYRAGTKAVEKYMPGMKTCVNFGTEATDNILGHGNDWYEIYKTGALTYGVTEDWQNICGTYQFGGFQSNALRMVCQPNGYKYGIYNICYSGRTKWEIEAKGFSHIGQGVSSMTFFSYGPVYASVDSGSGNPDMYKGIKTLTYATGANEDAVLGSKVARGDVAMLYSRTGDIWAIKNRKDGNHYGKERTTMHMLLAHCGVRAELITEYDLASRLKDHKMLFALDRHIERENLIPIIDWVKKGGILYLAPGALEKGRYDEVHPEISALKLPRSSFALKPMKGYYLASTLYNAKPDDFITADSEKFSVIFKGEALDKSGGKVIVESEKDEPLVSVVELGKGKIIMSTFFLGLSYAKTGKAGEKSIKNCWSSYSPAGTLIAKKILDEAKIKPLVSTDNYLVEAHLLEGANEDLIVLSNWNGAAVRDLTLTLNGLPKYVSVKGVRTAPSVPVKNADGSFSLKIPAIESGDIISCRKK